MSSLEDPVKHPVTTQQNPVLKSGICNAAAVPTKTKPTPAAESKKQPAAVTSLTVGEMIEKHLHVNKIRKKHKTPVCCCC